MFWGCLYSEAWLLLRGIHLLLLRNCHGCFLFFGFVRYRFSPVAYQRPNARHLVSFKRSAKGYSRDASPRYTVKRLVSLENGLVHYSRVIAQQSLASDKRNLSQQRRWLDGVRQLSCLESWQLPGRRPRTVN